MAYHVLSSWRLLEPQSPWNHYTLGRAEDFVQFAGHKRAFPEGNGTLGSAQRTGQSLTEERPWKQESSLGIFGHMNKSTAS